MAAVDDDVVEVFADAEVDLGGQPETKSPIAKESDVLFCTASDETNYRVLGLTSRYSQLAIFDTLYSYAVIHKERAQENIESIEDSITVKRLTKKDIVKN